MRAKLFLGLVFLCLFLPVSPTLAQDKSLIGARHPAISPDGRQIAFSYMGDIWVVSADGGLSLIHI